MQGRGISVIDVKDRVPTQPNRRKITYSDGRVEYVTIEYADNPTEQGTPINKVLFDSIEQDINLHVSNNSNPHNVTAEQTGAAITETYNVSIPTTGWNSSAPYSCEIEIVGITENDNPIIDIVLSDNVSDSSKIINEWSNISRIITQLNSIKIYCYDKKPTMDIPIQLKVVR